MGILEDNEIEDYDKDILNNIFLKKYYCVKKIGQGCFSPIYKGNYQGQYYALKFEKIKKTGNRLEEEVKKMKYLESPNIPSVIEYGSTNSYNILVMQLLGKNLKTLLQKYNKFSVKTVCMLGYQMIFTLKHIHEKQVLHRDIKPENFAMGLNDLSSYVYLIDFGLSKNYTEDSPLVRRPFFSGNAKFASINTLKGYNHCRRDELESLGYIFVYFLKGKLPWEKEKGDNRKEIFKEILEKKTKISSHELCKDLPVEFQYFLEYSKGLEYNQKPDYNMLMNLLLDLLKRKHYKFDFVYEWTTPEEINKRKIFQKNNNKYPINQEKNILTKKSINNKEKILSKEKQDNVSKKSNIKIIQKYYYTKKDDNICCGDENGCFII